MVIPRVVHQIWLGPDPLPEREEAFRGSWGRLNPGWEIELWTEDSLPAGLRRPEVYERLRQPAERADILRLELLWRFGGVYVDTDCECRQPLEPLLDGVELFVGDLKPGRTNNAIIGAIPEHPLIGRALDELTPVEWHGADPKAGTGPHFLDALLRPVRDQITVFPPPVFYPSTDEQREAAVVIHHAARSWVDSDGLRYRLEKAERRAAEAAESTRRAQADLETLRHGPARKRAAVVARLLLHRA